MGSRGRKARYPRVGYEKRQGKPHRCKGCGESTNQVVVIQVSWFRGDDDVYWFCKECKVRVRDHKNNDFYEAQRIYNLVQPKEHATHADANA